MATKAHLEGNKRYLSKLDDIKLRVPQGQREIISVFARNMRGMSLNAYIVSLIERDMKTSLKVEQTGN